MAFNSYYGMLSNLGVGKERVQTSLVPQHKKGAIHSGTLVHGKKGSCSILASIIARPLQFPVHHLATSVALLFYILPSFQVFLAYCTDSDLIRVSTYM